jgi:hypothetical protein
MLPMRRALPGEAEIAAARAHAYHNHARAHGSNHHCHFGHFIGSQILTRDLEPLQNRISFQNAKQALKSA